MVVFLENLLDLESTAATQARNSVPEHVKYVSQIQALTYKLTMALIELVVKGF